MPLYNEAEAHTHTAHAATRNYIISCLNESNQKIFCLFVAIILGCLVAM